MMIHFWMITLMLNICDHTQFPGTNVGFAIYNLVHKVHFLVIG